MIKKILASRLLWVVLIVLALLGAGGLFAISRSGLTLADLRAALQASMDFLAERHWLLFLALAVLPGLGFPAAPLILLAGAVWSDLYSPEFGPVLGTALACAQVSAGIAVNVAWCYWLAAYPARSFVAWMLSRAGYQLPDKSLRSGLQLVLLVRLTPGLPLVLQNYALGFLRPPFISFMLVSVAVLSGIVVAFTLLGRAMLEGEATLALVAIFLAVLAVVATRQLRRRYASTKETVA